MGFRKRGYSREVPQELVKDYKLFAIACEGDKTEPKYFRYFEHLSDKIKIDVIEHYISDDEMSRKFDGKSAPNWVLDRAIRYIDKNGLDREDELWFVVDKDRWSVEMLTELANFCADNPNWHIAVSNPCFEVWLYLHKKANFEGVKIKSCQSLKNALNTLEKGGYHPLKFLPLIKDAATNAAALDSGNNYFMPEEGSTKIYQLILAILEKIRASDVEKFITEILPKLLDKHKRDLAKKP
jgi:hypothetical protein